MRLICITCNKRFTPEFADTLNISEAPRYCLECEVKQEFQSAPFVSMRQQLPTKWDDKTIRGNWNRTAAESRAKIMDAYNKRTSSM